MIGVPARVKPRLIRQADLCPHDEARIRTLLVAAFPQHAALFGRQSYWGSVPDWRLVLEGEDDALVAHTGFGMRDIVVGDARAARFRIAGVGAVCTAPGWQRRGLGRRLFDALRDFLAAEASIDFAFLECREAIVPFYQAAGFSRFDQPVWCLDPDRGAWSESLGPKMLMPIARSLAAWPSSGRIDLRGMPW